MARAVQANLVQLKVADAKRRGISSDQHHIRVPAPGYVRDFRETLIEQATIAGYPREHLELRIHEIWGQFCVMLWLFSYADSPEHADLAGLATNAEMRCGTVLEAKHDEIHAIFWLLHFEQRKRHEPSFANSPDFGGQLKLARQIPGMAFGKPVEKCSDGELLRAACEYAGMLAAIRWIMGRASWGDAAAMAVGERPF